MGYLIFQWLCTLYMHPRLYPIGLKCCVVLPSAWHIQGDDSLRSHLKLLERLFMVQGWVLKVSHISLTPPSFYHGGIGNLPQPLFKLTRILDAEQEYLMQTRPRGSPPSYLHPSWVESEGVVVRGGEWLSCKQSSPSSHVGTRFSCLSRTAIPWGISRVHRG